MNRHLYYSWLYLSRGLKLVWRNRFASLILLVILSLLLFIVYIFVTMSAHTAQASRNVDDKLVVTALVAQDDKYRSTVDVKLLASQAKSLEGVRDVRIVSEEETQRRFLANVGNLQAKPAAYIFQEALEISVTDVDNIQAVRDRVAGLQGVERANYLADIAEKLTAVSDYIRNIALAGAILLSVIALLVVMAVVRTSIHAEARSVAAMASVGGSPLAIAAPLIVHLLVVVMCAATIASIVGWWVDPKLGGSFGQNLTNLPDWLKTGRAFGIGQLWLPLVLTTGLATSTIVAWSTLRFSRRSN